MAAPQEDGSTSALPLHGRAGLRSACMTSSDSASSSTGPHILRDSISLELAELDEKEKAIMAPICRRRLELRRLWNRSLPIHKLPHELLVQIFEELPHSPWRRRDQYTSAQHPWLDIGWPGLMLVCRHWRDLVVSTPTFWREIHSKRKASWTSLCISRSAAISINVHVESRCSLNFLDNIRSHVHRFREFYFSTEADASLLTAIIPFFNDPMRLLEKLHFTVNARREASAPIRINARVTSKWFPSLKVLVLKSPMVAPQDVSLYAQLRTLELDGCSVPLPLDGFLDALAASMQLEELRLTQGVLHRLSGEWPYGKTQQVPFRPYASLPRLRHFQLSHCRVDRTSRFLAHLHLRPFTDIYIIARVSDETTNTVDAMLPPNRNTTFPALGLATMAWLAVNGGQYSISSSYCRPRVDGHGAEDSSRTVLQLDSGNRAELWGQAMGQCLDDLVQTLGASPLTFLFVDGDQDHGTAAAWERVFRAFPLLEELSIPRNCDDNRDVINIFRGLHAASRDSIRADSAVACPNLRDVRIGGTGTLATFEEMRDCFRYRGEKGVVLELLNIQFLAGWMDVPSPLRHEIVRDISGAVKVIRTPTAHNVSEWGREHQENNESDDEIALVM